MLSILFIYLFFMELILIMWISNIIVMALAWYFFFKSNENLANKLLQIEIIKKAKTFDEAKNFWTRNIAAEQNLEKKIIDEQEKAFIEQWKKELTSDEKLENEWEDKD